MFRLLSSFSIELFNYDTSGPFFFFLLLFIDYSNILINRHRKRNFSFLSCEFQFLLFASFLHLFFLAYLALDRITTGMLPHMI